VAVVMTAKAARSCTCATTSSAKGNFVWQNTRGMGTTDMFQTASVFVFSRHTRIFYVSSVVIFYASFLLM
jgi:hypothetical protein